MSPPPVTVAVVSFNTRELLLRCLASLGDDVRAGRARVVIVDNGSDDGSAAAARRFAPWVQVIERPDNPGFGAAVNLVARHSDSPWLIAANADVAPAPGALQELLAAAGDDAVGALAPRLVAADGSTQHSVWPLPTVALAALFALGLPRLWPALGERLCLEGRWDPEVARTVPWAIGAFLLLRRTAFDAVGGFDERQWMYAEDLDLGWRLRDRGYRTRYVPRALVAHSAGAATEPAFGDARRRRFTRAGYVVIARRRGPAAARLTAAVNVAGAAFRVVRWLPLGARGHRRRAALRESVSWLIAHLDGLGSIESLAQADRPAPGAH
jgi:N-acetylglucosaminyl-diphospho-decaprenol L-rhamnosyltransferase